MSTRLLLGYLTLTVLVLAVLEVPLGITHAHNQRQDLTTKVERDAVVLSTYAEDTLEAPSGIDTADVGGPSRVDTADLEAIVARYQLDTGSRVVAVDAQGDSIVDSSDPQGASRSFASRPEIAEALAGRVSTGVRRSKTLGADLLYVAVPVASGGEVHGALRITYPVSAVQDRILRYWLILAAIAAVVLAVVGVVGLGLARSIARPLADVERAAAAAAQGDLTARAPVDAGPPEVRSLATGFNEMVVRVDGLLRSREAFVADASHQLRTPLAALRLRLENLERDVAVEAQPDLDAALTEVARLSRLVDGLLELARADSTTAAPATIDLTAAVSERLDAWAALGDEQGVQLVQEMAAGLAARATPGRIEQVLDNLLANALEASPEEGTITVAGRPAGALVELHVIDQGPGMSDEERTRAFDRFWRASSSKGGSGLGLAIVDRLVRADGGRVELRPAPRQGLDVVVRLQGAEPTGATEDATAKAPAQSHAS